MSPLFTINFRREAYQEEMARVRRRVVALGVWLAYFGVLALVLGLYVLNGVALARRVRLIEAQVARAGGTRVSGQPWDVRRDQLNEVERYVANPRQWRQRLARLAALTPDDVVLTGVIVNPNNLTGNADQNSLLIRGSVRPRGGAERMQSVMDFVSALHHDPGFSRGYQTVRLAQSQTIPGSPSTEFAIECR